MTTKLFNSLLFVLFFAGCSTQQKETQVLVWEEYYQYLAAISADSTQGRAPATEGYDKAARYCANLFKQWGLRPAGDDGTYFQKIKFVEAKRIESSFKGSIQIGKKIIPLQLGKNFMARPLVARERTSLKDVPIMFAGFGIDAPELNYSDFEGIDVKGKIVLASYGTPRSFNNEASAIYTFDKRAALKYGALGVIVFNPDYLPFEFSSVKQVYEKSLCWKDNEGNFSNNIPNYELSSLIDRDLAIEVLKTVGLDIKTDIDSLRQGVRKSKITGARVSVEVDYFHSELESANVVAKLEGLDDQLKNESIIFSAHLDHLGVGTPVNGDSIYNGTLDNASGSAGVLLLAHHLANTKSNKRGIIFLLATAEEKGLLGSDFYGRHPTIPRSQIVADINIDEIRGLMVASKDFIPYGYEYSTISSSVDVALRNMNLRIGIDKEAEEGYFVRSDQFSFIKVGIPSIYLNSGYEAADSTKNAELIVKKWGSERYHQPSDDLGQPLDTEGGMRELNVVRLMAEDMLNRTDKIEWKTGTFLQKKYAANK